MRRALPVCLWLLLACAATLPASAIANPVPFTTTTYGSNPYPFSIAAGDLSGDGLPDLVVANALSANGTLYTGLGAGAFGGPSPMPSGNYSTCVAIGDLNADDRPDVVMTDANASTVAIYLGVGGGLFAPPVSYATGSSPYAVVLGDFDLDGKPDLAVANNGYAEVSILMNLGNGVFGARREFAVSGTSRALASGDLDGDGRLDLVVANSAGSTVTVLRGAGDGTFTRMADYSTGGQPYGVALADLDGDGKLDLALANSGSGTVSVLPGHGDGSFGGQATYDVGGYPYCVAVGDLDLDGRPDLAVGLVGAGAVDVLLATGDGTFGPPTRYATGADPFGIAIADLNNDSRPDLAVANEGSSNITVMLNATTYGSTPSSVVLTSAPDPSVFGQPVTLTATVAPSTVTGIVAFYEGSTVLGTGTLAGGVASLVYSNWTAGSHVLTANFPGDPTFRPSWSPGVTQAVTLAATSTAVGSSDNPSLQHEGIHFTATVTAVSPGGGTPAGGVQFVIDGAAFGAPVPLTSAVAASASIDSLDPGPHDIVAAYVPADALHHAASTSAVLHQSVERSDPQVVAVHDVPNDQGGSVFVTWRCPLDKPGIHVVTAYRIWRRVPAFAPATANASRRVLRAVRPDHSLDETYWEALTDRPAAQLVTYGYTAATTQDSLPGSNPYTAFFVQALTADPLVWYDSAPDSGYSVDNLAPPTPLPFVARYSAGEVALHWLPSRAPDVHEFRLYRGASEAFVPGPGNLVLAGPDTGYVDHGAPTSYYKLAAVDVHGNYSPYALVSPENPTAALASLVSCEWTGTAAEMLWYGGSLAGTAVNVYRSDDEGGWSLAAQVVADGEGYVRYSDATVVRGHRYGYRLGIPDSGAETLAGEVSIRIPGGRLAIRAVVSNPVRGSVLTCAADLSGATSVTARVLDLAGRVVRERAVSATLSGTVTVSLEGGTPLRPGVYLLELRQGSQRAVTRFTYLH